MLDVIEDTRNELKIKLADKFEQEVIAFLNTAGGNIFIGVNDKGNIIGINGDIDLLQRKIKDRIVLSSKKLLENINQQLVLI
ncbi:putative uncharacterized protein [Firmicutes bacterium CAG:822]|mgnify:FL=1|nr:putative uncharacterized protein [Firmicutes bacterium CAG:822]